MLSVAAEDPQKLAGIRFRQSKTRRLEGDCRRRTNINGGSGRPGARCVYQVVWSDSQDASAEVKGKEMKAAKRKGRGRE
jgi:hypothetical protein